MLTRSSQIGEFYIMSPPQVAPTNGTLHTADMMIYDEESDKHVRITWREALDATLAGDADVAGADAQVSTGSGAMMPLADWKTLAESVRTFNEVNNGNYEGLKNSGALDIRIVVARPFIEHLMHNAILAVSGRETGATLCVCHRLEPRPRALAAHVPRPLSPAGSAPRTCN